MASLTLRNLTKSFDGHAAVHDVSLHVEDGELLVLVGPSGCGKSTLLRLIAGLVTPDRGSIELDGTPIDHLEPGARDVAMVFQSYALYPHMTVRGNIAFPLRMAGVPRAERRAKASEAAAQLGIEDLLERKPGRLSGGQQQRVALARALVREPRLFLFDEPLSNVDAKLRAEMRAELAKLHRRLGATIVHVTHDQVEAMTLGTRIAVLHEGRVLQEGAPLDVYRRPANRFVATFLGSPPMNLLSDADRCVGFRPHEAEAGGEATLLVEVVEPLGQETLVHGRVQPGGPLPEGRAILALGPDVGVGVGESFSFGVPRERLHAFDPESGDRID